MRVIPKITVFDNVAYTTIRYEKNFYLGCPINVCKIFNDLSCQELILNFVGKNPDYELAKKCLLNINVPVTLGGFSRDLQIILDLMEYGAEKIIFPQKFEKFGSLEAKKLSQIAGNQAIAACFDLKEIDGEVFQMTGDHRETKVRSIDALTISKLIPKYFGEVIINNVTADGMFNSNETSLIQNLISSLKLNIPILECGGLTSRDLDSRGVSGVVLGTEFSTVFSGGVRSVLQNYPESYSMERLP